MDSSSTEDLVQRAKSGCRESFDLLVEKNRTRLYALIEVRLWSPLRDQVETEDVYQETCLKAFESISNYQEFDRGSFFKWLGGIAEHVIQTLARKGQHRAREVSFGGVRNGSSGSGASGWEPAAPNLSPGDGLRSRERFEQFKAALSKLTRDQREVIILSLLYCLKTCEIAERMNRTSDAVSMLRLRAVQQLRLHIGSADSFSMPPTSLERLRQELDGRAKPPANGNCPPGESLPEIGRAPGLSGPGDGG